MRMDEYYVAMYPGLQDDSSTFLALYSGSHKIPDLHPGRLFNSNAFFHFLWNKYAVSRDKQDIIVHLADQLAGGSGMECDYVTTNENKTTMTIRFGCDVQIECITEFLDIDFFGLNGKLGMFLSEYGKDSFEEAGLYLEKTLRYLHLFQTYLKRRITIKL